jgi:hypothetical protein
MYNSQELPMIFLKEQFIGGVAELNSHFEETDR